MLIYKEYINIHLPSPAMGQAITILNINNKNNTTRKGRYRERGRKVNTLG